MSESSGNKGAGASKDGLALIIGGIFILALVFAAYKYFNKGTVNNALEEEQSSVFRKEVENQQQQKGDLNGPGTSVKKNGTTATGTGGPITPTTTWVANDYKQGDIKGNSYTVKSGDTLWEIAEGTYGNGFQWTKILEANKSSVGFLPNGSQALIVPGQVLVIP